MLRIYLIQAVPFEFASSCLVHYKVLISRWRVESLNRSHELAESPRIGDLDSNDERTYCCQVLVHCH